MNRTRTSALLLIALAAAGCIGGPGNAGTVWIRNESGNPVDVSIAMPSHRFLVAQDRIAFRIPPWQNGWCYGFGYGINAGDVSIEVAGPSVTDPAATTIQVPSSASSDVIARVSPGGALVVTAGSPPPEGSACDSYPQLAPSSSP